MENDVQPYLVKKDNKIYPTATVIKLRTDIRDGTLLCGAKEACWFYSHTYKEVNANIVLVSTNTLVRFFPPQLKHTGYYYCYGDDYDGQTFISVTKLKVYGNS